MITKKDIIRLQQFNNAKSNREQIKFGVLRDFIHGLNDAYLRKNLNTFQQKEWQQMDYNSIG